MRHSGVVLTMGSPAQRVREFQFESADFDALRKLIKQTTGIHLADSKMELVYGRISRRLRHLGLTSFAQYRRVLERENDAELIEFCNAMTTNLTSFFREAHHFDYLREAVLRPMCQSAGSARRVRIWSAACSSGEEPYSIAMTVCEAIPDWQRWDIKILATDVDSNVLATAKRGAYPAERLKSMPASRVKRFFRLDPDGTYTVAPELRALITFKQLNLMHELPMTGPLDVVFCRNVVIYFDKSTQRLLFERIAKLQRTNDVLFLGHSESLFKVTERYGLIGKTIYRRG